MVDDGGAVETVARIPRPDAAGAARCQPVAIATDCDGANGIAMTAELVANPRSLEVQDAHAPVSAAECDPGPVGRRCETADQRTVAHGIDPPEPLAAVPETH